MKGVHHEKLRLCQGQNEDRQMIAMAEQGDPGTQIYLDKISGKDFERPRYKVLLRRLRLGDDRPLCPANLNAQPSPKQPCLTKIKKKVTVHNRFTCRAC
jgi:hypothetical protein